MNERHARGAKSALIYAILIICGLAMIMPFVWMISTSLKTNPEANRFPPTLLPSHWQWQNYRTVWQRAPFARFYLNSIIVTVIITACQLATCSTGAYAFARLRFKGRDKLFLLYVATLMIPFQVTMIPLFFIIKYLHLINTYWAIIIPAVISPYGTFLLRQFFMTLPGELEESIKIDGGGYWTIFTRIVLPLSKPALATLGVFVFQWCWNNFLWPLIVINTVDMNTLPLGVAFFQGRYQSEWNYLMVAATISLVPVLVVYMFAQKYFVEGITLTGIKA